MKWWQIILWPLSLLYGSLLAVRNGLYNIGLFKSVTFEVPTIVVGNLESIFLMKLLIDVKKYSYRAYGGNIATGKSPGGTKLNAAIAVTELPIGRPPPKGVPG